MKKRILPLLMAVLVVFAMMPVTAGTVFAVADSVPPTIDASTLTVRITDAEGNEKTTATAGDTVTISVSASDGEDGSGINNCAVNLQKPITGDELYRIAHYDEGSGKIVFSFSVNETTEAGTWKIKYLYAQDASGNYLRLNNSEISSNTPSVDLSAGSFTVLVPPQLPSDLSTAGDNDSGYKLVFDGVTGNRTYYLTEEESVTPNVKIYYQDESGARELLKDSKYDLKILRQTSSEGDSTYEDTAFPLTYGENRKSTYKISAAAREDSGYTGETQAFTVTVIKKCKVTFDTRGGSSIDPQYVIPGEKATEPAAPSKEGWHFNEWFTDEGLTEEYWFGRAVNEDITLHASWYAYMALGVYNASNPDTRPYSYQCGTVDITAGSEDWDKTDAGTMNFTAPEGDLTFTAKPAAGYVFKGWYKGLIGNSYFVEGPSDELFSADAEYTCPSGEIAICAVFECAGHQWESVTEKEATCESDGSGYEYCPVCGVIKEGSVKAIPAKGHQFSPWTTTKKATETAAGQQSHKCSVCGKSETKTIAQLPPTLPAVKITKPKAAKKSATVKWKKVSKADQKKIAKIQIQYSTDKNFKTGVKTVTAKKSAASKKIKKLTSKKTYYVRIRAYKKSGGAEHISKWSTVKPVKVK